MPWASSFLFLSFIRNNVSYVLLDQHLLDLDRAIRRLGTYPDGHQTSFGIVDTDGPVHPGPAITRPIPSKDLGRRHRNSVPRTVSSLGIHHRDPQSDQCMIQRQQIVS
jgi:hypothetical protein